MMTTAIRWALVGGLSAAMVLPAQLASRFGESTSPTLRVAAIVTPQDRHHVTQPSFAHTRHHARLHLRNRIGAPNNDHVDRVIHAAHDRHVASHDPRCDD